MPFSPRQNKSDSGSDNDLYDEVSEDEYKSIVRGRLMGDDFIEDDDGSGYVDDGRDDWNREAGGHGEDYEDSEDENDYFERTGRRKKKSKKTKGVQPVKGIAAALSKKPSTASSSDRYRPLTTSRTNAMDVYRPQVAPEGEDDFMKRLMGDLGSAPTASYDSPDTPTPLSRVSVSRKRKQMIQRPDPFASLQRSPASPPSSDPLHPPSDDYDVDVHVTGSDTPPWMDEVKSSSSPANKRIRATSNRMGSLDIKEEDGIDSRRDRSRSIMDPNLVTAMQADFDDDDDMDFAIAAPSKGTLSSHVNMSGVRAQKPKTISAPAPAPVTVKKEIEDIDMSTPLLVKPAPPKLQTDWKTIGASVANVSEAVTTSTPEVNSASSKASTSKVNPFETDGRQLRFFWLDYTEQQGIIYLMGKVKDRNSGKFVSACLLIEGIERCVYFQPKLLENGRLATEDEIYDEFDSMRSNLGIKSILTKWVTRKYAFEAPGVPAEGEYLKVKYGFDEPQLPLDLQGNTFSRIFGANTSAFELFVVKRKIMGPCWLNVEQASIRGSEETPLSWCKIELSVDDAKFVKPFADTDSEAPRDTPPLNVMSISARTVVNHRENKREIVTVAARTWKDVNLEEVAPPEQLKSDLFSAVRPLGDMFPVNFEREAKSGNQGTKIMTVKYERMLLNTLLAQIQLQDPDVIVGHDFSGVTLDVLLHRMKELRADHWSRLGRLRRPKWPNLRQGFNLKLMSGRLVCDLASETAKGMITSTTWSLTEMCSTHLGIQREELDPDDTASFFDQSAPTPERLLSFIRHNEVDAYFQMALASKVQILPLTKQLTNLAGNAWSRTLNGGRAERNEYILLHDFHKQKYICPDKLNKNERLLLAKQEREENEEDEDGSKKAAATGKKDKYKGGLVFDPKKGLWDRYILVMDFNSLYPSIIQEFNIDFTTVDRKECNEHVDDVDRMPEVPSSDVQQGVLPRLISTLVARRRQVKSLMKDRNAPASKQLQWNIKQLALKLTANSMYGCLGFEGSRFYARPLAALTTYKGREILTATKELAESLGLDVIYGDTDSVMINTNALQYEEARRIGVDFKRAVNERYRLLEIDIDAVFERMLLLQKKKYAAIKVDEDSKKSTEIKGLDMKRREYSALSKNVSTYVLEQILSGENTETVVERIHEYLEVVSQEVKADKMSLDDFIIYKRLSKKLSEYSEQVSKSLPHVQVARRMEAKGVSVRMGDVVPYIFCLGEDGSSSIKGAQASRAFHPDEIRRGESGLKIDFDHYLACQILPPIERLCESIIGTDRACLASHLDLDPSSFQSTSVTLNQADSRQFVTLDSQTPDQVRFAACESLKITCGQCKEIFNLDGLMGVAKGDASACKVLSDRGAILCSSCDSPIGLPYLIMQVESMIRKHIARYYQAWSICTEPSCNTSTRLQSINAKRCLVPGCKGKFVLKYSDKELYDQLCYFEALFDGSRYLDKVVDLENISDVEKRTLDQLQSRWLLGSASRRNLELLRDTVTKYTARSGRRFVGLEGLFGWMKVAA
jgi:DNA polymerase alpha subunit A